MGKGKLLDVLFDDMQRKILYLLAHKEQIQTFVGEQRAEETTILCCLMIAAKEKVARGAESKKKSALCSSKSQSQRQKLEESSRASDFLCSKRGQRLFPPSCRLDERKSLLRPRHHRTLRLTPTHNHLLHPSGLLENKSLAGEFNNIYCIRAIRLLLREKGKALTQLFMKRDERMLKY
jgi:hypothetical protein